MAFYSSSLFILPIKAHADFISNIEQIEPRIAHKTIGQNRILNQLILKFFAKKAAKNPPIKKYAATKHKMHIN